MDRESLLVAVLVSGGATLLVLLAASYWLVSRLQAILLPTPAEVGSGREGPAELPPTQQAYRLIVAADIERFGRAHWDDRIRVWSVRAMSQVFTEAFRCAGIPPERWHEIRVGDALLVLVEPEVGTANVLRALLDRLPMALSEHNRLIVAQAELRLRVLLHAGHLMLLDDQSAVGAQLNLAFRLLDAEPLRKRLRESREPQVVAVSQHIFEQVVRHRALALDPDEFEPELVESKETVARLWIHSPSCSSTLPGYPKAGTERVS
jgi:hypothetical protein